MGPGEASLPVTWQFSRCWRILFRCLLYRPCQRNSVERGIQNDRTFNKFALANHNFSGQMAMILCHRTFFNFKEARRLEC